MKESLPPLSALVAAPGPRRSISACLDPIQRVDANLWVQGKWEPIEDRYMKDDRDTHSSGCLMMNQTPQIGMRGVVEGRSGWWRVVHIKHETASVKSCQEAGTTLEIPLCEFVSGDENDTL